MALAGLRKHEEQPTSTGAPGQCVPSARALAWQDAVMARFPTARPGGICNCRNTRTPNADGGFDYGDCWSTHAFGEAVDMFGPMAEITAWANQLDTRARYLIVETYSEGSHNHTQFIPSSVGCSSTPPCAGGSGGGGGDTSSINSELWTVITGAGFVDRGKVPSEPHGLSPAKMAYAVAMAESGGDLTPGGNLFQLTRGAPADPKGNARAAYVTSAGGSNWTPWCTAFGWPGDPESNDPTCHGHNCECGHRATSYLRAEKGRNPAYFNHVEVLSTGRCDPRCDDVDFNLAHSGAGQACEGCSVLTGDPVRENLGDIFGCENCSTLCIPGIKVCFDKVFAALGVALAVGVMLFGIYLVVRSAPAGAGTRRFTSDVFGPLRRAYGTKRRTRTPARPAVTPAPKPPRITAADRSARRESMRQSRRATQANRERENMRRMRGEE